MLTLTTARGPEAHLSREQRVRLASRVLSSLRCVEFPVDYQDDPVPAPWVEGKDDFQPAPHHLWCNVPVDGVGWSFEWTFPVEVQLHGEAPGWRVSVTDPAAWTPISRADADTWSSWDWDWDWSWDRPGDEPEVVISDDGEKTEASLQGIHFTIEADSIVIQSCCEDDYDLTWIDPGAGLVGLLLDETGWYFDAEGSDPEELEWVVGELALQQPELAQATPTAESAQRLLDTLVLSGALQLRPGATAEPVLALLARQLEASRPCASDLASALLACPEVEELFAPDAALGALLAAW